MATTLKDIAARANVSSQTVSRILRGQGENHREETRQQILEIARELDYRPNLISRSLSGGKSMAVGVISKGVTPIASEHIKHFTHAAQEEGYLTYTANVDKYGDDSAALMRMARDLLDRKVDGLMVYRGLPVSKEAQEFLENCGVPVVFFGTWAPENWNNCIELDVKESLRQLAAHLKSSGHQHIAYFPSTGQRDYPEHKLWPALRIFARAGVEPIIDPSWWIKTHGPNIAEDAYRATHKFLIDGPKEVTCIMMVNDIGCLGALAALREKGLRVPEDYSLVGFDNMDGAKFCNPALTTIASPNEEKVGQAAFDMLETLIGNPDAKVQRQKFEFELIPRESTGAITSRDRKEAENQNSLTQSPLRRKENKAPSAEQRNCRVPSSLRDAPLHGETVTSHDREGVEEEV